MYGMKQRKRQRFLALVMVVMFAVINVTLVVTPARAAEGEHIYTLVDMGAYTPTPGQSFPYGHVVKYDKATKKYVLYKVKNATGKAWGREGRMDPKKGMPKYYKWGETTLVGADADTADIVVGYIDASVPTTRQVDYSDQTAFVGIKTSDSNGVKGGALFVNSAANPVVEADFIGNYASSTLKASYGGAVYIDTGDEILDSITGDFIDNHVSSEKSSCAGAIYISEGKIGSITGDFIGNSSAVYAGAIENYGYIGTLVGDFIGNYASSSGTMTGEAGAIENMSGGTINTLKGDFVGNYASSANNTANGGAIYNSSVSSINALTGNFIGNYVSAKSAAHGGAIWNWGTLKLLAEEKDILFSGNYVSSQNSTNVLGGAIYNLGSEGEGVYLRAAAGKSITFEGRDGDPIVDSVHNQGTLSINEQDGDTEYKGTVNFATVTDSGTGTMNIHNGTVNVAGTLTQKNLDIKSGATMAAKADDVNVSTSFTNAGTLVTYGDLNHLTQLTNSGTVQIASGKTLNVTADMDLGKGSDGVLDLNNSILNMQQAAGATPAYSTLSVKALSNKGELKIDVDLAGNNNDCISYSNYISIPITLSSIHLHSGLTEETTTSLYVLRDGAGAELEVEGKNKEGSIAIQRDGFLHTFTAELNGQVQVKVAKNDIKSIEAFFDQESEVAGAIDEYDLVKAETINNSSVDVGSWGARSHYTIGLNGQNLTGEFAISIGSNATLSVYNTSTTGTISGFETAFVLYTGSTLELENVKFGVNDYAVDMSGGKLILSGTNDFTATEETSEGQEGRAKIEGDGDVTNKGTLKIATANLLPEDGLKNDGTMYLTGGKNNAAGGYWGEIRSSITNTDSATAGEAKTTEGRLVIGDATAGNENKSYTWLKSGVTITQKEIDITNGALRNTEGGQINAKVIKIGGKIGGVDNTESEMLSDAGKIAAEYIYNDGYLSLIGGTSESRDVVNYGITNLAKNTASGHTSLGSGIGEVYLEVNRPITQQQINILNGANVKNNDVMKAGTLKIFGKASDTDPLSAAVLTSNASNLKADTIINEGTLEFTGTGGTLESKVTTQTAGARGTIDLQEATKIANTINNQNIIVKKGYSEVTDDSNLISGTNNVTFNGDAYSGFDFRNGKTSDIKFNTINLEKDGYVKLDVDLANKKMDTINAETVTGSGKLHITAFKLLSDATVEKGIPTEVIFTETDGLDFVSDVADVESDTFRYHIICTKLAVIFEKQNKSQLVNVLKVKNGITLGDVAADGLTSNGVKQCVFTFYKTPEVSETVKGLASSGVAAVSALRGNDLQKRLGDLRGGAESNTGWARFERNNDDINAQKSANVSGNLYQIGYDFALKNDAASRGYFGVSLERFDGSQSLKIGGGDLKSTSLGVYYTKIYNSGHYFDLIFRYGRSESDTTTNSDGLVTKLDYALNGVSFSGEYGYRWNLGKGGVYLEPQVELYYGYIAGAKKTSSRGLLFNMDNTNRFITRWGVALGQRVRNFNYYLRASYLHDFAGTVKIAYGDAPYEQDGAKNWWEVSLGGGWNISDTSYFYAEFTKHFKDVSNSLNFNLGFRFTL
ncbi:MAG: autotransporter outer membrane beta-barrel domain-containing protein [Synergistaceae bacterium]|nr:autotransporter outer membrane beta-barrel domain-containing protein [Synergistaceae bacterium]